MKVVHIFYQSLPNAKGASIRGRDIIKSQQSLGIDAFVISSPFQPPYNSGDKVEVVDEIKYYRTFNGNDRHVVSEERSSFFTRLSKLFCILSFIKQVVDICKIEKPDIIHAHATFFCGIAGLIASKMTKTPLIYEVRSLWDERNLALKSSITARAVDLVTLSINRFLEKVIFNNAQSIVAINKSLAQNLISRGCDESKVKVVGNAVLLERGNITYQPANKPMVYAYVGSLSPIEGLDMLIEAFNDPEMSHLNLHIYGDGPELSKLKQLKEEQGMENVVFKGWFTQDKVAEVYKSIDVIVNPRIKSNLTDSVTPLKPLEAMKYRKIFLGSDVGGIKELVSDGENGFLFRSGDIKDLLKKLKFISSMSEEEIEEQVTQSYDFLVKERSWVTNAKLYKDMYEGLRAYV